MFLSSRQAGYSNRQQGPKNLEICRDLESDKCEVSGRYFVVGGQIAGCRHILTGLQPSTKTHTPPVLPVQKEAVA